MQVLTKVGLPGLIACFRNTMEGLGTSEHVIPVAIASWWPLTPVGGNSRTVAGVRDTDLSVAIATAYQLFPRLRLGASCLVLKRSMLCL